VEAHRAIFLRQNGICDWIQGGGRTARELRELRDLACRACPSPLAESPQLFLADHGLHGSLGPTQNRCCSLLLLLLRQYSYRFQDSNKKGLRRTASKLQSMLIHGISEYPQMSVNTSYTDQLATSASTLSSFERGAMMSVHISPISHAL
jgi:hypothetical protein